MARNDDDDTAQPAPGQRPRPTAPKPPTRPGRTPAPTRPAPPVREVPPAFNHARWLQLHDEQLDLDVRDPSGHYIGTARAVRKVGPVEIGGWKPVDRVKHVLVGEFDHYGFYNPPHHALDFKGKGAGLLDPAEADFNIFITPDPPFHHLLADVAQDMSRDDRKELHKRKRKRNDERDDHPWSDYCIECEITPDEEFYDNNWFPTRKPYSALGIGNKIGVYGPWVRDLAHKGRPEIHPCEVIWTRVGSFDASGFNVHVLWRVLVLQDDSNRFDRYSNFAGGDRARPWSDSPRQAHLTMAVQVPRREHSFYTISVDDGRRVFEHPGEEARSVTREHDSATVLTVRKRTSRPKELKVRLSELVPDPADAAKLRAFVEINVQVGDGDRGKEGFVELRIEHFVPGTRPPDDDTPRSPSPSPSPSPLPPPASTPSAPGSGGSPGSDAPPRHEP